MQVFSLNKLTAFLLAFSASVRASQSENVALIVGGFISNQPIVEEVELYGCAGANNLPIAVAPFPSGVYLSGATYLEEDNVALICGGYTCAGVGLCGTTPFCLQWRPSGKCHVPN